MRGKILQRGKSIHNQDFGILFFVLILGITLILAGPAAAQNKTGSYNFTATFKVPVNYKKYEKAFLTCHLYGGKSQDSRIPDEFGYSNKVTLSQGTTHKFSLSTQKANGAKKPTKYACWIVLTDKTYNFDSRKHLTTFDPSSVLVKNGNLPGK